MVAGTDNVSGNFLRFAELFPSDAPAAGLPPPGEGRHGPHAILPPAVQTRSLPPGTAKP